jgi:hypothetical protein
VFINRGLIYWRSKLQPTPAWSTAEAEYMAVSECAKSVHWLRLMLSELHCTQHSPTLIWEDNQSCIKMSNNPAGQKRTRHIDIRHHYILQEVECGNVKLQFCPTKQMLADILTKHVNGPDYEYLRDVMMNAERVSYMRSSFDVANVKVVSCRFDKMGAKDTVTHPCSLSPCKGYAIDASAEDSRKTVWRNNGVWEYPGDRPTTSKAKYKKQECAKACLLTSVDMTLEEFWNEYICSDSIFESKFYSME